MHLFKDYPAIIDQINAYYSLNQSFVFAINFKKNLGICEKTETIDTELIKYSFNEAVTNRILDKKIILNIHPIGYDDYKIKFDKVARHIAIGNSYLCNLTQASKIELNLNLEEIFKYSQSPYKFFLRDCFVVFSPETFVEIKDGNILTYPMKGTISADKEENKEILLNDIKEDAEHNTIVDLLRNDLSIVAHQVRVNVFKTLQKIETHKGSIWQMSSEITGKIKSEYIDKPGNLFDKILPAGSISGAPKAKTISIIEEVEQYDRGFYSGIFGICENKIIKTAVMIRFIERNAEGLVYKSGGGITSMSVAEKEYQELIQKIYVPVF